MTQYDPYSYGQVPLGQKNQPPATPDDLLFAEVPASATPPARTQAMAAGAPAAESDWAPVAEDGFAAMLTPGAPSPSPTADPLTFGADVLGEVAPAAMAAPHARRKAAGPVRAVRAPKDPSKPKEPLPRRIADPLPTPPRTASALGAAVATAFGATGLGWATWLVVAAANPIFGGIVAGASVVGAALAWLLLRR